ncbi:hypothetical protein STAS_32121 [Striga asiatica]|uniref:Uncharacterized protein n=1 Tax=Striga asiatica TaxID=4170 RepID=A0A5A7RAT2_STRAF|nr:hypothetical protein STAS_32121 [Striga asiatica]
MSTLSCKDSNHCGVPLASPSLTALSGIQRTEVVLLVQSGNLILPSSRVNCLTSVDTGDRFFVMTLLDPQARASVYLQYSTFKGVVERCNNNSNPLRFIHQQSR